MSLLMQKSGVLVKIDPMSVQEGTVQANGRELEYHRHPGQREEIPPIVMLHEGLGSVSTWHDFPALLAARTGAEVFVYSRYGYGRSAARQDAFGVDYMHIAALSELPEFLTALNIKRPILFGHSDGASIALICGGAHPTKISGIIVEAPHVFTEEISVNSIAAIRESYEASDALHNLLSRHHTDPDASFYGWNAVWQLPKFRDWNIEGFLPDIQCPTIVLQGTDDEYGTTNQVDRIVAGSGGLVETLILGDCGHAPHRDQLETVLAASKHFVDAL
jgi:pimeloyl-ACP methyl ester carboxylesterase